MSFSVSGHQFSFSAQMVKVIVQGKLLCLQWNKILLNLEKNILILKSFLQACSLQVYFLSVIKRNLRQCYKMIHTYLLSERMLEERCSGPFF